MSDMVAVVHNGIIENFRELRSELTRQGYEFSSDTDTEVVAHLVTRELKSGQPAVSAVRLALQRLEGAFALAIIFAGHDNLMVAARRGSPLAIGYGDSEMYLAACRT
jgi:glucosamine--fructose-6-phosphate aminotransferase (isomerizing)